jgi:hypothetical protein
MRSIPRRFVVLSLLSQHACAPPVPLEGTEPAINLIYPTDDDTVFAFIDEEDGACKADLTIAVDVLNLDFIPPDDGQVATGGEGHYHLDVGLETNIRPDTLFYTYPPRLANCPPDKNATLSVRVFLVDAEHQPLETFDHYQAISEPHLESKVVAK